MQRLTIKEVRATIANAPPRPPVTFKPNEATVGPYACPVCMEYQLGTTLIHQGCMRAICAGCIMLNIESDQPKKCPHCRDDIFDPSWLETSRTNFIKPPPNDQYWIDRIQFDCQYCKASMSAGQAHQHRATCAQEPRHEPPAHIQPWHADETVALEVVSNPPSNENSWNFSTTTDKLFIINFNGRQITSKFIRQNKTVLDIKKLIGDVAECQKENIKIYKFIHRELLDDSKIRDVANREGATFIAAFNNIPDCSNNTVMLALEEVGRPLYNTPKPPAPPTTQNQTNPTNPISSTISTHPPPRILTQEQVERRREARRRRRDNRAERFDSDVAEFWDMIRERNPQPPPDPTLGWD